ncbi:MAG: hypothetical protein ACKVP4_07190 [Hyphomicrobium sp.]
MVVAALRLFGAFAAALAVAVSIAVVGDLPAAHAGHSIPALIFGLSLIAIPGGLLAIALSEAWRVRGLLFWLFAGLFIAWEGLAFLPDNGWRTLTVLTAMGLAGGYVYWRLAGRRAGRLAAAIVRSRGRGDGLPRN